MKTRMISAAIGLSLLAVILFFFDTLVLNLAVSVVCAIMVYEIFCTTNMFKRAFFVFLISLMYAILFPFANVIGNIDLRLAIIVVYVLLNIFFLLKQSRNIKVYDIFFCCLFCIFVVMFTSNIIYMRKRLAPYGIYYAILFFIIAWVCDAGGYFVGTKFGRLKLAPNISPKKTVEGAIGGVILTFFCVFIYNLLYINTSSFKIEIDFFVLFVVTIFGAFLSIIGDLIMSVFKRQHGVKDFGNILKGHGGMLDRFDSWIFVVAVLYQIVKVFPIILY